MNRVTLIVLCLAVPLFPLSAIAVDMRLLDMTFPFDSNTIYWPTDKTFELKQVFRGMTPGGWWYASHQYGASEHGGTHVDAPIHFAEGGRTIDQIPLTEWIGPAVTIDVRTGCAKDRDCMLTTDDILSWERLNGPIPPHAWVIMYSGLDGAAWPDRRKILGTDKSGREAAAEMSFPGFSPEAASFLIKERDITGIAVDTPSIDRGKSSDFQVHRVICGAGKLALENIAHLDQLPSRGATLFVMPMMIRDGTGAPARVFAEIPPAPDTVP